MISSPTSKRSERGRSRSRRFSMCATAMVALLAVVAHSNAQHEGKEITYSIASRVEDPQTGDVWTGTLGGGLLRKTGGRVDAFDQLNSGLPGNVVFSVALVAGRVFAATNGGTCSFDPYAEEWRVFDPRRSDRAQPAVIELRWESDRLLGRQWGSGTVAWDESSRSWTPSEGAWPERVETRAGEPAATRSQESTGHRKAIAVLGPGSRRMALPGDESPNRPPIPQPDMVAAQQAARQANRRFGLSEESGFVVADATPGYDRYGWRLLEDDLVRAAAQPDVAGVIAYLDDRSAYTEAAASFLNIPMVNIADRHSPESDSPTAKRWIFRCRGDDARQHRMLLDAIASVEGRRRWTVIVDPSDPERQLRAKWTRLYARHLGLPDVTQIEWNGGSMESSLERCRAAASEAIFVATDPSRAAEWILALRSNDLSALIILESDAANSVSTETIGMDAGPMLAPAARKTSPESAAPPSSSAISIRTSAAADHLIWAIRHAEGNRDSLRRKLMDIEEDPFGEAHAESHQPSMNGSPLARWVDGRWVLETPAPDPVRRP